MKQPMDHLKGKKHPAKKTIWIAGDSELAEELSELEASLSREESVLGVTAEGPRREAALQAARDLRIQIEELRPKVRESSIKFVFRAMGAKKYDALLAAHQPTPEQIEEFKMQGEANLPFNPETFPIALIVACCEEPQASPEDLEEWLRSDDWNSAEIMTLFMAASNVNQARTVVNLGKD